MMSDLWNAAKDGDIEEVRRQIADHADINSAANEWWGATPLLIAVKKGLGAIVDLLMQHGANVNQARTDNGETPLMIASLRAY